MSDHEPPGRQPHDIRPQVQRRTQRADRRENPLATRTTHLCGSCGDRVTVTSRDSTATCKCGVTTIRAGRVQLTLPRQGGPPGREP